MAVMASCFIRFQWAITCPDNGMWIVWRQTITWITDDLLLIILFGTRFSEILIKIKFFIDENEFENGGHFVSASLCISSRNVARYNNVYNIKLIQITTIHQIHQSSMTLNISKGSHHSQLKRIQLLFLFKYPGCFQWNDYQYQSLWRLLRFTAAVSLNTHNND